MLLLNTPVTTKGCSRQAPTSNSGEGIKWGSIDYYARHVVNMQGILILTTPTGKPVGFPLIP